MLDLHYSFGAVRWLRGAAAAAIASALVTAPAFAAIPKTSLIDGVLTSSGGSAAADGDYDIVFTIYDAASGGNATWTETAKVKVAGGRFSHPLGSVAAIDTAKLIAANAHWLALKVGSDPELPRQALHANLFTHVAGQALALTCDGCVGSTQLSNGGVAAAKVGFNYAGSSTKGGPAIELECTACVSVSEMKFDGDVDLAGNSIKAKNGTFSGDVAAATVTATSFIGDGSKLTGIKTPSGECKTLGEVVKGINSDGSLKCIAAMDPAALPKDGLNEISNDLLSNQFIDTIEGDKGVPIPDKTGTDAISNLVFPDIGTTQSFEVYVEVANTDLSAVSMTVLPPDDKKTGWVLCDPCGEKDAKSFKKTFAQNSDLKSGDLEKWLGTNPKGTWNLKVLDNAYCIPQQPGNAALCDTVKQLDGTIVTWSIKIKTLSNKKIAINGDTYQGGTAYLKDVSVAGTLTVNGTAWYGHFPAGSRPLLYGWIEDHTESNWVYQPQYPYAHQLPLNNDALHMAVPHIVWGDTNGNFHEGHGGVNYGNGNNERSRQYLVALIKNPTTKDVTQQVCFNWSSHPWGDGNYASLSLNGSNLWSYTSNNLSTQCVNVTYPAGKSSALVLKSGTYMWTQWNGYYNKTVIGFYNNSFNFASNGLEWDYARYNDYLANKFK